MKISYNWLKQYVDLDITPEQCSEYLTNCGLEVEGMELVESVKGGLRGLVIGEVLTCEKHPNADKLSKTTVNVGGEEALPIVCGAPNVAAGQKVVVATVGTELWSGDESFSIKKSKIRGEVSMGMICAEDEIGMGKSHDGILVLPAEAQVGTQAAEYFEVTNDWVYEIGLTPNRADATSHIGSARDMVAVMNRFNGNTEKKLQWPSVDDFKVDSNALPIPVEVEAPEACPRYSSLSLSGVKVTDSPQWLQDALNAVGLRPINNVVDITNYVMMEVGQPLHAFDADKIEGGKVVVKKMPAASKFTTLDEVERELHADDLMICNATNGMCIAGVFGGTTSGVSETTTKVFLESAYFDPTHVRKTAKRHTLKTDASFRFERGCDPNITVWALKRAAMLIKEIAGGEISSEISDIYPEPIHNWEVAISYEQIDNLIGNQIERELIQQILRDLDIVVKSSDEKGMLLEVPTNKVDVKRPADIIEEILRVYGYNHIVSPDKLNTSLSSALKPDKERFYNHTADFLAGQGYLEAMNNSQTSMEYVEKTQYIAAERCVKILNPLSRDLNIMRPTLLFGLLESLRRNINHKVADVKLFEFGKQYFFNSDEQDVVKRYEQQGRLALAVTGRLLPESWNSATDKVDFYDLKSVVERTLARLGMPMQKLRLSSESTDIFNESLVIKMKKREIARIGNVRKNILKTFDIKQEVYYADINWDAVIDICGLHKPKYQALPKFHEVRRDLALVVDQAVTYDEIKELAFMFEKNLLKEVNLFDVYEGKNVGEGKKSYAVSFALIDENKTLTDKVIDKTMNKLIKAFEDKLNAQLR